MHDDQLREQFARWARPLVAAPRPDLPVLRRRARQRIVTRAAISGLAAAVVAVVAVAVSGFPGAGHAAPAVTAAPNPPRYAMLLQHSTGGDRVSVLDMDTGKTIGGVVGPPAGSEFDWVAASTDDRTFVLADQSKDQVTRFYELHLTASGKPAGRWAPLDVRSLQRGQVYGMALTADASKLAVAWQNAAGSVSSHITVTTLATGATRTWTSDSGSAGAVSWAGDRTVAFEWQDTRQQARSGVRLLSTAAPGAGLLDSRLIIGVDSRTHTIPSDPLITQDGSTVFALMAAGADGAKTEIVSYSADSGKLRAVLVPATGQNRWYCGILWTDPHGTHIVTQCGTTQASIEGYRYTKIHLPQLIPASQVGFANTFAW